jgi:hypothetical protein
MKTSEIISLVFSEAYTIRNMGFLKRYYTYLTFNYNGSVGLYNRDLFNKVNAYGFKTYKKGHKGYKKVYKITWKKD